jgi:hypothetical protein
MSYGKTVIVRWMRKSVRSPSLSSTDASRRPAFVGFVWNCMKSRCELPAGICPRSSVSAPLSLASFTGDGSIVLTVMLSSHPGLRTSVACLRSRWAVMWKRA